MIHLSIFAVPYFSRLATPRPGTKKHNWTHLGTESCIKSQVELGTQGEGGLPPDADHLGAPACEKSRGYSCLPCPLQWLAPGNWPSQ